MPPAPLLWLFVFAAFSISSAEVCVGSLVSGCTFDAMCFTSHGDLGRGRSRAELFSILMVVSMVLAGTFMIVSDSLINVIMFKKSW